MHMLASQHTGIRIQTCRASEPHRGSGGGSCSPSYKRMRESLEVMSSWEAWPGSHCMPVILRPLALPRLFFTSAEQDLHQPII